MHRSPVGPSPHRGGAPGAGLLLPGGATRRQFLRTLAAAGGTAGLAGALSGCGGSAAAAEGTVRFWTLFAGPDGILMRELLDEVEAELGARVDSTTLSWGAPYYTKLAMASAGGRAPEMAVLHLSRLQGYAPGGLLDPWDLDLLAEFGVGEADFAPAVWERTSFEGQTFAIPLDTHPFIMFFNPEIADAAGLSREDLDAIDDPEDFLEAGRALQGASGDLGISYGFINDGAQVWRLFYTFYAQHGAELVLEPGRAPDFDRDAARASLAYMQRLFGEVGNPTTDVPSAIAEFQGGRSGALFNGEWELKGMENAGVPFDATTIPTLFGTPAAFTDSHTLVLPHQDEPDEATRRLTHEVAASMLQRSILWASAGHIPGYTPVVESPEYAEFEVQPHYASAAEKSVLDPAVWFAGAGSEFQNRVGGAMQGAIGGADVDAALDRAVSEMQRLLDLPAPE